MKLENKKIGYCPKSKDFSHPGDRRRFIFYAKRKNLQVEIAKPHQNYDLLILNQDADLSIWLNYKSEDTKVIFECNNSYLAIKKTEFKGLLRGLAKFITRKNKYLRFNYWKMLEAMCLRADAVVCSTDDQKSYIKPFCNNVQIILDAQDEEVKRVKSDYEVKKIINIVWEGMAGNIYQVLQLKNVFSELEKKYDIALHFITDLEYYHYAGVYGKRITEDIVNGLCKNVHIYEWDQKTFSDIVCSCDIAVIPIDLNNPLAKGKPENKLLLFWRMGMPTITSATTTYSLAMKKAGIDLTCYDNDDWFIRLEKCILDEDYRRSVGINGKRFADSEYSDEMIYQQWDSLISTL